MKRRHFIKSSLIATGVAGTVGVGSHFYNQTNKIRFGYYYPADSAQKPLALIISELSQIGLPTEVHNLSHLDYKEVIQSIQQGQYAGVLMSTDLVADVVPELNLLADGPDSPKISDLQSWYNAESQLWSECLAQHNLVRLPICAYGPRRGIWVNPAISELQKFDQLNIYAYGLWGHVFSALNANTTNNIINSQLEAYLPSNLFIADQIHLVGRYKFISLNNKPASECSSPSSDFYLNNHFWESLSQETQAKVQTYAKKAAQHVTQHILNQDQSIIEKMGPQTESFIDMRMLADLSKEIRFRHVRSGLSTDLQQRLFNSYLKSFETT